MNFWLNDPDDPNSKGTTVPHGYSASTAFPAVARKTEPSVGMKRRAVAQLAIQGQDGTTKPDPIPQPQQAPAQQDAVSGQAKMPPTEENVKQAISAQQGTPVNELPAHLQMPEPPFSQDWLKANWDKMSFGDRVAATASWKRYRKDVHDTFLRRDRVMSQNIQTLRGAGGKYGGRWVVTGKGKHRRPSLIYSGETRMRPARSQQEREQMLVNPAAFLEKDDYGEGPFGAGSRTRSPRRRSRTRGGDVPRMNRFARARLGRYPSSPDSSLKGANIPANSIWGNMSLEDMRVLNMSVGEYQKYREGADGVAITPEQAHRDLNRVADRAHRTWLGHRPKKLGSVPRGAPQEPLEVGRLYRSYENASTRTGATKEGRALKRSVDNIEAINERILKLKNKTDLKGRALVGRAAQTRDKALEREEKALAQAKKDQTPLEDAFNKEVARLKGLYDDALSAHRKEVERYKTSVKPPAPANEDE